MGTLTLGCAGSSECSFDILRVKNEKGVEQDVYFDITELFAEEAKLFGARGR